MLQRVEFKCLFWLLINFLVSAMPVNATRTTCQRVNAVYLTGRPHRAPSHMKRESWPGKAGSVQLNISVTISSRQLLATYKSHRRMTQVSHKGRITWRICLITDFKWNACGLSQTKTWRNRANMWTCNKGKLLPCLFCQLCKFSHSGAIWGVTVITPIVPGNWIIFTSFVSACSVLSNM